MSYDVIVLGVGGFGSGAVYHCARRGLRVLGIERFGVAHDLGSSHGETRIIRKAYFEHPDYVPLLVRAYELWRELEAESERSLLHLCGLMLAGPPEGEAVGGARLSARLHNLKLENFTAQEARERFPGFRFRDEFEAVYEPEAGYLEVENCVRTHIERATAAGAELRTNETVTGWKSDGRSVRVTTDRGEYHAANLIITAGAWASQVLAELHIPLEVLRKPLFWHRVSTSDYNLDRGGPAYLYEMPDGCFYGFPSLDGEILKVAEHSGGRPVVNPLEVDRTIHDSDTAPMRNFLTEAMPGVQPEPMRHSVCMYTMTPDRHFIVDRHPEFANVAIGAGFSGHGFKFTSSLGEALADLATKGETSLPIGFLSFHRSALRM
ncbi:MAG: N-methyl-L-tryptophan oxidase [Planctomycetaceae bacterium]